MLELFKDDIPELDKLTATIREMIRAPKYTLEDIREAIVDHIPEYREMDPDDDEGLGEVSSLAYDVIDDLMDHLDETKTNYKRIKDYISSYRSYNGFNRLIVDFEGVVPAAERKRFIEEGKRIFGSDITENWI